MLNTAEALANHYSTTDPEALMDHLKIEVKDTAELPARVQAIFTRMNGKIIFLLSDRLDSTWKMYLQACAIACVQLDRAHELFIENMNYQMDVHAYAQSVLMLQHDEREDGESVKNFLLRGGIPQIVASSYSKCLM